MKEVRAGEIGAVLLADHVRTLRIRDVEAFRSDIARLEVPDHDLAIKCRSRAERRRAHCLEAGDELLGAGDFLGASLLVRTDVELRLQRSELAFVQTRVSREIRIGPHLLLEDGLEPLVEFRVARPRGLREQSGRNKRQSERGGTTAGEKLATVQRGSLR